MTPGTATSLTRCGPPAAATPPPPQSPTWQRAPAAPVPTAAPPDIETQPSWDVADLRSVRRRPVVTGLINEYHRALATQSIDPDGVQIDVAAESHESIHGHDIDARIHLTLEDRG